MKKKLLLLLIIFIPLNIKAETIYGDYYKVNNINDYNSDEVIIRNKKYYNTYNIEKIDKGYLTENNLYQKDIEDFIIKTNKTKIKYANEEFIDINYPFNNKKVNYIYLTNIYDKTEFNEIKIYNHNTEIKYRPINNYQMDTNSLFDNDEATIYKILTKYEVLKIYFDEPINLNNLKIELYTNSKHYLDVLAPEYNYKFRVYFTNEDNVNKHTVNFLNSSDFNIENYFIETSKLYKYYDYVNKPTNIYLENSENIIEDDYKLEVEYYKRDKLILDDNLVIDDITEKVDDFVLYASDIVFINCNINYDINGIYECNYKLKDLSINKNIIVNINHKEENVIQLNNKIINKEKDDDIIFTKESNDKINLETNSLKEKETNITINNKYKTNKKDTNKNVYLNIKLKNKVHIRKIILILIFLIELIIFILKRYKRFCRKGLKK